VKFVINRNRQPKRLTRVYPADDAVVTLSELPEDNPRYEVAKTM